jgi:hypothetical protein
MTKTSQMDITNNHKPSLLSLRWDFQVPSGGKCFGKCGAGERIGKAPAEEQGQAG